ncbi:MAG: D-2-hydroxyacid dehydrogenase [Gemmatimonadota bacterium]
MSPTGSAKRLFLLWMHSPRYPAWSVPRRSLGTIREALGQEWELRSLEVELYAPGDGAASPPAELLQAIRRAEVYCGFGIQREAFLAGQELRWVHSGTAGVGASLFPEMRASDVLFTNSAGVYAEPMAEHAIAMILHFARGLDVAAAGARERVWRHPALAGRGSLVREVSGSTLTVVGLGGTGRAVARRAAALGMRVVAIRRNRGISPPGVEVTYGPEGLPKALSEAEFVVLTLPETPETEGLIGAPELAAMGPECVLINLSRGGVVEETALIRALEEGRLRGAGLDVFRREPLPQESPLWRLENVLITPHTSGVSPRFWERETALIVRNIGHYLAGEPLENRVDKELGY